MKAQFRYTNKFQTVEMLLPKGDVEFKGTLKQQQLKTDSRVEG